METQDSFKLNEGKELLKSSETSDQHHEEVGTENVKEMEIIDAVTDTLSKICEEITSMREEEPSWKKRKMESGLSAVLAHLRSQANPEIEEPSDGQHEPENLESIDLSKLNRKERRALLNKSKQTGSGEDKEDTPVEIPHIDPIPYTSFSEDGVAHVVHSEKEPFSSGAPKFGFDVCDNNYVKQVVFSPCGQYLASTSQDRNLRVFSLNEDTESLLLSSCIPQGDCIYHAEWHPCGDLIACTSKFHPIHLYDVTGEKKATYRGINHLDELTAAMSMAFSRDGSLLYGGYKKLIKVWDVRNPGKQLYNIDTYRKKPFGTGQNAIISSIEMNPLNNTFAVGSYGKFIALYSANSRFYESLFGGDLDAVTDLKYSANGTQLFSSGRKTDSITCWDLRNTGKKLFSLRRPFDSNHKIYFDLDVTSKYLFAGTSNGEIAAFDLTASNESEIMPVSLTKVASCAVPAVSAHVRAPLIACCSGERVFPFPGLMGSSDGEDEQVFDYKNISKTEDLLNGIYLCKF